APPPLDLVLTRTAGPAWCPGLGWGGHQRGARLGGAAERLGRLRGERRGTVRGGRLDRGRWRARWASVRRGDGNVVVGGVVLALRPAPRRGLRRTVLVRPGRG